MGSRDYLMSGYKGPRFLSVTLQCLQYSLSIHKYLTKIVGGRQEKGFSAARSWALLFCYFFGLDRIRIVR